jgi:hypothetical protein
MKHLRTTLTSEGFVPCVNDPFVYRKTANETSIYVATHVDDLLILSPNLELIVSVENFLKTVYEITVCESPKSYLGMDIYYEREKYLKISMPGYTQRIINDYLPIESNVAKTPAFLNNNDPSHASAVKLEPKFHTLYMKIVGCLLYLAISTRPDILFAVHSLTQHLKEPTDIHLFAAYRVLRYLKGSINFSLFFYYGADTQLQSFADAAYANNHDLKSQHGICFRLGSSSACFYSITKKQNLIALSSTEAEYIALSECVRELLWFRSMLNELGHPVLSSTPIFQDNRSCIKIAEDPSVAERTKHIDIRHHFIREKLSFGEISLIYTPSSQMVADILTKPLSFPDFYRHATRLLGEGTF